MFDNAMTAAEGFAMHEEQLALAAARRRVKEAERTTTGRGGQHRRPRREAIAQGLLTLAEWLAPGIRVETVAAAR